MVVVGAAVKREPNARGLIVARGALGIICKTHGTILAPLSHVVERVSSPHQQCKAG